MKNKSLMSFAALFLVLFIDGMGLALLFPILNGIVIDPHSAFLSSSVSAGQREFLYGFIVGIFMLCWFFGAAILGDLSDQVGRKKSLMICLVGAFFGYLLSAIAVIEHSLVMLILGRIIAGFTAGSQPIAQAAIVDMSTDETRTRNIALILLAVSLGFVFGPILGGVLSDPQISSWFSLSTPLYFAAVISLLNSFLLWGFFKETAKVTAKLKIKLHQAINVFVAALKHNKIRKLSIIMLVEIFGWSNYFAFSSLFMMHHYHFHTLQNSLFLAVMGLGFAIGFGYIMDFCAKRFDLKRIVVVSLILTAIGVTATILVNNLYVAWTLPLFIGITMALAYSGIITLFSQQVSADEQGWVMGVTGSIMALSFGISTLMTGVFSSYSTSLPLELSIAGLAASAVMLAPVKLKN